MSRDINPFGLRMPPELRHSLEEAAKASGRSLNAEIVSRLEGSFAEFVGPLLLNTRMTEMQQLDDRNYELLSEINLLKRQRDSLKDGDSAEQDRRVLENKISRLQSDRTMVRAQHERVVSDVEAILESIRVLTEGAKIQRQP